MEKIRKAGALIILEKRLLIVRPCGKSFFINPGGKYEENKETGVVETAYECLERELKEELKVKLEKCVFYRTYEIDKAVYNPKSLSLELYFVKCSGEIVPSAEIECIEWMDRKDFRNKKFNLAPSFGIYVSDLIKEGFL